MSHAVIKIYFLTFHRFPSLHRTEPATIHLAGELLKQEKLAAAHVDENTWKAKVVVADPRGHFHRMAPDTEMTDKGPKASNQLDKLKVRFML